MKRFIRSFLGLMLLLQIKGDGYYPWPRNWPREFFLGLILVEVAFLLFFVYQSARAAWDFDPSLDWWPRPAMVQALVMLLVPLILGGHLLQGQRFAPIGYQTSLGWLLGLGFGAWVLLLVGRPARSGEPSWKSWLWASLAAMLLLKLYPLLCLPITAQRSDMLPILKEAGLAWLQGEGIYRYYPLDNGILTQNVRLPGMVFLYLPWTWLGWDLRWMLLLCEGLFFAALIQWGPQQGKAGGAWSLLMGALMFFPYWHWRHELYEAPFWLLLLLTLEGLRQRRLLWVTLGLGAMVGSHQWGWLFFPFFLVHLYREQGFFPALKAGLGALALGMVILTLGVRGDWSAFGHHVFGYYQEFLAQGKPYLMSLYFTAWLSDLGWLGLLKPMQVVGVAFLGLVALVGPRGLSRLLVLLTLALTWMLVWNVVAWTYQYLLVLVLLALAWLYRPKAGLP